MAAESLVLAVDDEPAVLNVLERILQREGYAVETAVNGVDAMLRFIETDYTFVMLDIAMPRMDGADTLRLMKKLKPEVPVVTFTGHVGRGEMTETVRLGAVTCLPKPITIDQLRSALDMITVEAQRGTPAAG
ncbi:MAG: response regulator [Chloroflexota bacterium]|mgnify:CR=1 FL=1|jgi:two-component system response regulator MprA|nr:response regulator [Chloroflexota bacterium]MDP6509092.1 response regulator [Chloroflexota bacterium]MDP6758431.1 response regulator [Chloroflexota bacterium]|tara:strand:- start:136 stop:531 length:396 start_codon:yes stop_codon:yes gene_type:complete